MPLKATSHLPIFASLSVYEFTFFTSLPNKFHLLSHQNMAQHSIPSLTPNVLEYKFFYHITIVTTFTREFEWLLLRLGVCLCYEQLRLGWVGRARLDMIHRLPHLEASCKVKHLRDGNQYKKCHSSVFCTFMTVINTLLKLCNTYEYLEVPRLAFF